jgi:hypothetical protein
MVQVSLFINLNLELDKTTFTSSMYSTSNSMNKIKPSAIMKNNKLNIQPDLKIVKIVSNKNLIKKPI